MPTRFWLAKANAVLDLGLTSSSPVRKTQVTKRTASRQYEDARARIDEHRIEFNVWDSAESAPYLLGP